MCDICVVSCHNRQSGAFVEQLLRAVCLLFARFHTRDAFVAFTNFEPLLRAVVPAKDETGVKRLQWGTSSLTNDGWNILCGFRRFL